MTAGAGSAAFRRAGLGRHFSRRHAAENAGLGRRTGIEGLLHSLELIPQPLDFLLFFEVVALQIGDLRGRRGILPRPVREG